MKRLNRKERKLIKCFKKKTSLSREYIEEKLGKKYLDALNSLCIKGIADQKLAVGQNFFDTDAPPGCLIPATPEGDYELTKNANEIIDQYKSKFAQLDFSKTLSFFTSIINLVSAFLKFGR